MSLAFGSSVREEKGFMQPEAEEKSARNHSNGALFRTSKGSEGSPFLAMTRQSGRDQGLELNISTLYLIQIKIRLNSSQILPNKTGKVSVDVLVLVRLQYNNNNSNSCV